LGAGRIELSARSLKSPRTPISINKAGRIKMKRLLDPDCADAVQARRELSRQNELSSIWSDSFKIALNSQLECVSQENRKYQPGVAAFIADLAAAEYLVRRYPQHVVEKVVDRLGVDKP
jgi:hypothetical protein